MNTSEKKIRLGFTALPKAKCLSYRAEYQIMNENEV